MGYVGTTKIIVIARRLTLGIYLQVTYFKQRRVMEHNRRKTLEKLQAEGARPMDEALEPSPQPLSTAS